MKIGNWSPFESRPVVPQTAWRRSQSSVLPEVRLVWQPVIFDFFIATTTEAFSDDRAIHAPHRAIQKVDKRSRRHAQRTEGTQLRPIHTTTSSAFLTCAAKSYNNCWVMCFSARPKTPRNMTCWTCGLKPWVRTNKGKHSMID